MSLAASSSVALTPLAESISPAAGLRARVADYIDIARPRIAVMVLVTVTVGYGVGCRGAWDLATWIAALVGVALAATSSSAFNQYLERRTDALMPRTARRALPAGRLAALEVLAFGWVTLFASAALLAVTVNPLTALLSTATIAAYALCYTPLKTRSSLCTAVGAIPGAMPPVLGWTSAGGPLDVAAFALFGILFLWQFPHFLAIGWKYRHQYSAAGLNMLLGGGRSGRIVGITAVAYALVLIPIALLPRTLGLAGDLYAAGALLAGIAYTAAAVAFAIAVSDAAARRLLLTSIIYLPLVLGLLLYDHWRLLG